MGKFDFEIPQKFLNQLGRAADVEKYAPQMINEAMPILENALKKEIKAQVKEGNELEKSIKKTKAKKSPKGGFFAVVRPTGIGKDGIRNMEKLAWLEYGHSTKNGGFVAPRAILTKSNKDCQSEALKKMEEVFEREMKSEH